MCQKIIEYESAINSLKQQHSTEIYNLQVLINYNYFSVVIFYYNSFQSEKNVLFDDLEKKIYEKETNLEAYKLHISTLEQEHRLQIAHFEVILKFIYYKFLALFHFRMN